MGTNVRQNIVTNGLVLYLDAGSRMSYTSGSTTWRDLSGQGSNGTLAASGSGAVSASFDSTNQGSILFSGTGSYVDNINQSFSIQDNTPFTTEVVFKATSTAQLIGNWNTLVTPGWRLVIESGKIRLYLTSTNGTSGRTISTTSTSYNNGSIYHACGVYSGNSDVSGLSIYVNSILSPVTLDLNTSPGTLTNSKITLAGSQLNTTNIANLLVGNIYQIKLYNRALSAQEIAQNYNATKTRYGLI